MTVHKGFYDAYIFAKRKHAGMKDDSGEDYFNTHLLQVVRAVMIYSMDTELWMAAVLHDTIEDTDTTYDELVDNFGSRVADLVMEVSHEGEKDHYGRYFPRLKTKDGILLKFCDRASNISRMEPWDEKRRQHYLKKSKFWKDGSDRPDGYFCDEILPVKD
jgi:(p)ppGpp synthase/HD superfamily hydrolase